MAKLLIFRGDTLHDERELTGQTVRIGRGSQNDIVLEDPGKGVSRNHAEIRLDGGHYTLVDLDSQNGTWVAGQRVTNVVLGPGVVAALGPFRLRVEGDIKASLATAEMAPVTELTQLSSASGSTPAPLELDKLAPAPPAPPATSKSVPPSKKVPAPPAAKDASKPPVQQGSSKTLWIGVAAVLLMLVIGFAAYRLMRSGPEAPVWNVVAARDLVAQGRCPEALDTHINPALSADPTNQEAQALKTACTTPTTTTPPETSSVPPTPTPTVDETLTEAENLLNTKECQKALDVVTAVLTTDQTNARATDLAAKAKACLNPVVANATPVERLAVVIPPAQGGLEPLPKETDKAYKTRMAAMRARYDDAVALVGNQQYTQAAKLLDDIASQVPQGYLELAQRREEVRAGLRGIAKRALDNAHAADNKGDFDAAADAYRRAATLDPSLQPQVEAAIQRMNERRIALGTKRCKDGLLEFSYGNNTAAIPALQDAVRLLPGSDPCAVTAKQRLQQIGK